MKFPRRAFLAGTALGLVSKPFKAGAAEAVPFQLHGAYYSHRLQIEPPLDPEVFVADPSVTVGGIGLENIEHIAGFRALRLDDKNVPLFTAEGARMGFTSAKWLEARGSATITAHAGGARVALHLERLIAFGMYSVFKSIPGASGDVAIPLDGTGKNSHFRADPSGAIALAVNSPQTLDDAGGLILIYHSDGHDHGLETGYLGVTAHQQLVAPLTNA